MTEYEIPDAHPLTWPVGVPRTKHYRRKRAKFRGHTRRHHSDGTSHTDQRPLSISEALDRLDKEVRMLGGKGCRISSDLRLRNDGWPLSSQRTPDDPGVACYFTLDKRPICLPCDKWDRIADNIAAVAAHVSAMRGMERWGVGTSEQAFRGYQALYSADGSDWKTVLENPKTKAEAKQTFLRLAAVMHPDAGGDQGDMARLNRALTRAEEELEQ